MRRALLTEVEEDVSDGARRIGDYELLAPIARGGMGIVYRARQRTLNRTVAIKLILAGEFAAPDFLKRFRIEAETVASLDHPNIVPIYEIGEDDGRHFFSMKLVEGGSLADRLARHERTGSQNSSAPPPSQHGAAFDCECAARLVAKLARAVHHAHQRGILHRDIKPTNVLLDANDEPLLTDFGLAKLVERETQITHTLAVLGTPSYISPEQAAGKNSALTTAVDVYGLGAVLYELLTGQPPFAGGTTASTIRQVLEAEPERPSRRNPTVHRDVETICLKCLEKDPARRYASAEALAEDLERWLRHEPILARPSTSLERTAKWVRRHPAYAAAIAISLGALFTVAVVSSLSRARVSAALAISEKQNAQIQQQQNELSARQAATVKQLSRSLFLQGVQHAEAKETGPALAFWAEAVRLDSRNHAAASRIFHTLAQNHFLQPAFAPIEQQGRIAQCVFSPDGSRIAAASYGKDATIWLRDAASGTLLHAWKMRNASARVAFSPDGRYLAGTSGLAGSTAGGLRIWEVASGRAVTEEIAFAEAPMQIQFSPDGTALALTAADYLVRIFDVPGGHERFSQRIYDRNTVAWAPDSKSFYIVNPQREVVRLSANDGSVQRRCSPPILQFTGFALSSDGERLLVCLPSKALLFDVGSDSERPLRQWLQNQQLLHANLSPDGKAVAMCTIDGRVSVCSVGNGSLLASFNAGTPQERSLFSPDGLHLLTYGNDNAVRVWDIASGAPLCEPARYAQRVTWAEFSPDGKRIVSGSFDGTLMQWQMPSTSGAELRLSHSSPVKAAIFSHSEDVIATLDDRGQSRLWDRASGGLLWTSERMIGSTPRLQFSTNDQRLMVVAAPNARVLDARTGESIGPILRGQSSLHGALSPDGETVYGGTQQRVHVWNARTGEDRLPPFALTNMLLDVQVSPDGQRVLTACTAPYIELWDALKGGRLHKIPQDNAAYPVRFTHQGTRMGVRASYAFRSFDVQTGGQVGPTIRHDSQFRRFAVSGDDSRVALVADDNIVRVFATATGTLVTEPLPAGGAVRDLALDRTGRRVAVATSNGRVNVYDVESARSITGPLWHDATRRDDSVVIVQSVQFSGDGRELLTSGTDGTARLWDLGPPATEALPTWLPDLAEAAGGLRLHNVTATDAGGTLRLESVPYRRREDTRGGVLAEAPLTNAWNRFASWFYAPPGSRAPTPLRHTR